jgi:hypothetical protein
VENVKTDNDKAENKETKISVSRIEIGGVKYLKSTANVLYVPETQEEVGIWNPETQTIKPLPEEEEDELEDEEYDEEEEEENN